MNNKEYYLSSMDSKLLEEPRRCQFEKMIYFDTDKEAIIASIEPPFQLQNNSNWTVVDKVILSARHEGHGLKSINYFPCFIYVASAKDVDVFTKDTITANELSVIGIAELCRTYDDAKNHIFDKQ